VVVLIQGNSASSSSGVSPGQKAVIVLVKCATLAGIVLCCHRWRRLLALLLWAWLPRLPRVATCSIRSVLCPVMNIFSKPTVSVHTNNVISASLDGLMASMPLLNIPTSDDDSSFNETVFKIVCFAKDVMPLLYSQNHT
jgi:hypothetical protein